MEYVTRIGVSLEPGLLDAFDRQLSQKGYASRSEALRDLIRESLAEKEWKNDEMPMVGAIVMVCDAMAEGDPERVRALERKWNANISTTSRMRLDDDSDMVVAMVSGKLGDLKGFTEELVAVKTVRRGRLAMVSPSTKNMHFVGAKT
ncbi:MAG: nickel-responsive transcriptional regulator NikR [Thermoplasmatales archaeon]|nr:nickel-responsive transcriptional regulator NikR [Thermoplasmatales archaeon]